jgi:hypothetical protein
VSLRVSVYYVIYMFSASSCIHARFTVLVAGGKVFLCSAPPCFAALAFVETSVSPRLTLFWFSLGEGCLADQNAYIHRWH